MTNTVGRTFGIEIETVGLGEDAAFNALTNAGINARTAGYSSRDYRQWSVKHDGSLSSPNGYAAEIVSPVMEWGNIDHYRQVETVCKALTGAGARVNRSCGLHVHVGASDLTRTQVMGVVKAYTAAQDSIDTIVAPSRVNGQWAKRWDRFDSRNFQSEEESFLRSGQSYDRYRTVNLTPYMDRGTVEFRQRNGSLNARKMLTWAGMVVSIVKLGAEYGVNDEGWLSYSHAAADPTGVYDFLRAYDTLDDHAEVWLSGARPVEAPETRSFSRLLSLQGR